MVGTVLSVISAVLPGIRNFENPVFSRHEPLSSPHVAPSQGKTVKRTEGVAIIQEGLRACGCDCTGRKWGRFSPESSGVRSVLKLVPPGLPLIPAPPASMRYAGPPHKPTPPPSPADVCWPLWIQPVSKTQPLNLLPKAHLRAVNPGTAVTMENGWVLLKGQAFTPYSWSGLQGGQCVINGTGFREGFRSITNTDIQHSLSSSPGESSGCFVL